MLRCFAGRQPDESSRDPTCPSLARGRLCFIAVCLSVLFLIPNLAMGQSEVEPVLALAALENGDSDVGARTHALLAQDWSTIANTVHAWGRSEAGKFVLAHFEEIWGYPLGEIIVAPVPRLTGVWRGKEVVFGSNTVPLPVTMAYGPVAIDFVIFINPIDYRSDGVLSVASDGSVFHQTASSLILTELSVLSGLSHSPARAIYPTIASNKPLQNALQLFALASTARDKFATIGLAGTHFMIPETTRPAFDALSSDLVARIPSGLDLANMTFAEVHAIDPSLALPTDGEKPVERADHTGRVDPNGPWSAFSIAHDHDEYEAAMDVIHQYHRHLAPGFILEFVAAMDGGEARSCRASDGRAGRLRG